MLSLNITRPKLSLSNTVPVSIALQNPVEDVGNKKYTLRGVIDNLSPNRSIPAITGCSYDAADGQVVAAVGAFENVRLGDTVSGTDIPLGAYVTAISTDASTITLSDVTTNLAPVTDGEVAITAKTIDATVFMIEIGIDASGNNIVISPFIHEFDGTKAFEGADSDGEDEVTVADASRTQQLTPFIINLDTYLTNARLDRTN